MGNEASRTTAILTRGVPQGGQPHLLVLGASQLLLELPEQRWVIGHLSLRQAHPTSVSQTTKRRQAGSGDREDNLTVNKGVRPPARGAEQDRPAHLRALILLKSLMGAV